MSKIQYLDEFLKLLETNCNCSICHKLANEPIRSKCQKICCKLCFTESLEKNYNICSLCNQKENSKEALVDLQCEKFISILKMLKSYSIELNEVYSRYDTKCIYFLDEYFDKMINQIDIHTEKSIADNYKDQLAIDRLNKTRALHLEKIKAYKDECISKRDENFFQDFLENLKQRSRSIEDKSKEWIDKLRKNQSVEIIHKELREIKVSFLEAKEKCDNKLFQEKLYLYDSEENDVKIYDKHITKQDHEVSK
jgi:hypothetical protein